MWFGLELAMMGMGTVFTFLVLLIIVTSMMSKFVGYIEVSADEKGDVQTTQDAHNSNTLHNELSDEILLQVISAAIQKHRHANHKT